MLLPRTLVLDTFPVSSTGKPPRNPPQLTDQCRQWISACIAAGHPIVIPAMAYYEALRELERLGALSQIARLRTFCFTAPTQFLPLTIADVEQAAQLWGQARNQGTPTADPNALDGDLFIAAQALSLGLPPSDYVVATTNTNHLSRFVPAEDWTKIAPGS